MIHAIDHVANKHDKKLYLGSPNKNVHTYICNIKSCKHNYIATVSFHTVILYSSSWKPYIS